MRKCRKLYKDIMFLDMQLDVHKLIIDLWINYLDVTERGNDHLLAQAS